MPPNPTHARAGRPAPIGPLAALALIVVTLPAPARADAPGPVDFGRDVLPILSDHCFTCHGPDAKARKADLRLDRKADALRSQDPVIVPGKAADSELVARITSNDPEEVMPPPRSGRPLSPAQVETLRRWIDGGAAWGKHWAFEPPRPADPPAVRDPAWPRNPIDRFVLARLEAEGLRPSPEAGRATLIRRLSLDLTGLPPTPAEVDAFLADATPRAYEDLVDRLLASPRYGERMATDWLDLARFADTNGYQNDFARTMWPWRDWVIAAFNANMPFDQFAVEQLAGDLLPSPTRDQEVATGFNRNNRTVTEAGSIDEEWRIENAVDRVETTTATFLGLTLGCARCHDHKFDPISQREFYGVLAFFNALNEQGVYTETRGNVPPLLALPRPEDERRLNETTARLSAAEAAVAAIEKDLPEQQRLWEEAQRTAPAPGGPDDWAARLTLDGDLRLLVRDGEPDEARGSAEWTDGPAGRALKLNGQPSSHLEARPIPLERTEPFSYGAWVRPRGDGALLSRMDDANAFRGFDLLLDQGKVEVHLVHAWPGDALKVVTRQPLPRDAWSHVLVTHDGSGKAAGVAVYVNGRRAEVDATNDALRGSIVAEQPLRVGSRSAGAYLNGDLADLRIYRRALAPDEVRAVVAQALHRIIQGPAAGRTPGQQALLASIFRDQVATGLGEAKDRVAAIRKEKAALEASIPTVMVMQDRPEPRPTFVLKRGRYDMPDAAQPVEPGVPAVLPPLPSDAPRNRLGLARWITSADNPLTARVVANRLWQQHFGTGLVKTAENFGLQGEPPSHPELLDWLALELVRSGWDLKALHRRIVTSATYRQSSRVTHANDPENRLLARGPRLRLPAEAVRDNALAVAGLLVEHAGGPSVKPYQPAGLWEELAGGAGEGPYVQAKGADLYRRSLYIYRKRTVPHPALTAFDAPSREVCQVRRPRTNTPLQALQLLNDPTYVEAARHLAQLMLTDGGSTPEDRITFAFRRATARTPGEAEARALLRGLDRYRQAFAADRDAAARLVRNGDSAPEAGLDPAELAAYTAAAGVILNLDETITVE